MGVRVVGVLGNLILWPLVQESTDRCFFSVLFKELLLGSKVVTWDLFVIVSEGGGHFLAAARNQHEG